MRGCCPRGPPSRAGSEDCGRLIFEAPLAGVAPGDYTLIATHEFTGPLEIPVTVKAGEAAAVPVELKK